MARSSSAALADAPCDSGFRRRVSLADSHGVEDATGQDLAQVVTEQIPTTRRSPNAVYRLAHFAAGVSCRATAKALGISPQFVVAATTDGSGKVANLEHLLVGLPSVCRAVGRELELAGADGIRPAASVKDAAELIVIAAGALFAASRAGDAAELRRAAHSLDDARLVFRVTIQVVSR